MAVLSGALFATTLTSHPALGDAPETVAGVASLGILHPPGYPAYMLSARLFTLLEPFGNMAFKVNLFSLLCASALMAGVYLLARRCGGVRWASALGSLALAATAPVWFYADFAKHDIFSGLVVLAALMLLLRWQRQPTTRGLVVLAAVVAIGAGSSWQLTALLAPAVGYVLFTERRRLGVGQVLAAGAVGLVIVATLYAFVLVRASQSPALNWGDASNPDRLVALITLKAINVGTAPVTTKTAGLPFTLATYGAVFGREMLVALGLAAWGVVVSFRRPRYPGRIALVIFFVTNLLGAAIGVGARRDQGFDTDLFQGGFLIGCFMTLAVWTALGATDLARRIQRAPAMGGRVAGGTATRYALIGLVAAVLLGPSLVLHRPAVQRAAPPIADGYASAVLGELKPKAVLFVWAVEAGFPIEYRQVVLGDRRDVDLVDLDLLLDDWYRDQLARRLHRTIPPPTGNRVAQAASLVESTRHDRPAYLDMRAADSLRQSVGFQSAGMVAEVVDGSGGHPAPDPANLRDRVDAAQRAAGLGDQPCQLWPDAFMCEAFTGAHYEVAHSFAATNNNAAVRQQLLDMLKLEPNNDVAKRVLAGLGAG